MRKVKDGAVTTAPGGMSKSARMWRRLRDNHPFLIMIFPAVLIVFLFNYLPIYGVLIAFQDFMPGDPIFGEYTQ